MSSVDIHYFHRYNTLARRKLVEPLTCSCGNEFVLRANLDGEPFLNCFRCNSVIHPGLNMMDKVKSAVERFKQ